MGLMEGALLFGVVGELEAALAQLYPGSFIALPEM